MLTGSAEQPWVSSGKALGQGSWGQESERAAAQSCGFAWGGCLKSPSCLACVPKGGSPKVISALTQAMTGDYQNPPESSFIGALKISNKA